MRKPKPGVQDLILIYLYTHEKMTENIALYAKIGYVEYDRRSQGDFSLVYMRKQLSSEDER